MFPYCTWPPSTPQRKQLEREREGPDTHRTSLTGALASNARCSTVCFGGFSSTDVDTASERSYLIYYCTIDTKTEQQCKRCSPHSSH